MESFYLTLPCSVKGLFHENVLSDYVTHLPRTIELEDKWEVALVEFHFTKSWYNVEKEFMVGITNASKSFHIYTTDKITPGKYTAKHLISEINRLLLSMGDEDVKPPKIILDPASNHVNIDPGFTRKIKKEVVVPVFDDELFELLGLTNRITKTNEYHISNNEPYDDKDLESIVPIHEELIKGPFFGETPFDAECGIHSIFIYCDIVEENLIGDSSVQCLRVCTLPQANFGETINITFDQPHYLPLSRRSFNSLRVTLKDKTNEQIKFRFGETLIKLHFKKC